MKKLFLSFLSLSGLFMASAQSELPLYGNTPIPNSKSAPDQEKVDSGARPGYYTLSKVSHPTLKVFLPEKGKANGTAVVVCPGGGYSHLAMAHEGIEVAKTLNAMGITAFVLKYRLPSDETMIDKTIGPLQDAQQAIRMVRQRAVEWGVNPARVGILGFSAGGHLASTAGTHFMKNKLAGSGEAAGNSATGGNVSLRPDFMVLLYPVISFSDTIGHRGSRDNLIGKNPDASLIQEYSNELQVTEQTPPTFLVHAEDDKTVPVSNSIHFYEALQHNKVPAEMHLYPKGGHGFGMHNATTKDEWTERLKNWLAGLW